MTVRNRQGDSRDDGTPSVGSTPASGVHNAVVGVVSGSVVQAGVLVVGTAHQPAARERPVPRQLPAAPPAFVGRAGECAELTAAVERPVGGAPAIAAICGAGGIGKTALALHWAHRHADRFPDGQLFVDLNGFSSAGEPMTPGAAVRGFLDALGVDPARIPSEPHAQTGLYRSLVAGKRLLIVLDNAADAEQLGPLLPGDASCGVLVTSRRRLDSLIANHGAHPVRLAALAGTEAHRLLAAHLGPDRVDAEPGAVADLLAVCGGFPLALAIVAGRARAHPHLPLTGLVAELCDEANGLDVLDGDDPAVSLPAVLSWSLRALTPWQRAVFGLLGIAPGSDIGSGAAASLLGVPGIRARAVLRELVRASLLDEHAPGRWRMHDLIRRCAVERADRDLTDAEREAALRRVVGFHLHTADAAARLLHPQVYESMVPFGRPPGGCAPLRPADARAALAWFRAEYPNLAAVERFAVERRRDALVWQLAWVMQGFRVMQGHHADNEAAWRAALVAAHRLPDPVLPTWTRGFLGAALTWNRRYAEATGHLEHVLSVAVDFEEVGVEGHAHALLAWNHGEAGDHERAWEHAHHALRICREAALGGKEAYALHVVGRCRMRAGDLAGARDCCETALALHRAQGDRFGEAEVLDSLGGIARREGRLDVVEHYRRAADLHRAHGYTYAEAESLDHLGQAHLADGQRVRARAAWEEALALYREQGRDTAAARVRARLDDLDAAGRPPPGSG
ncbi:ATP-binding protein [Saccharothrix australiensis]|uniref:Putative ATPase n=1 Tax=Saccharothrix australiensis TaxID=2072 RepID=A0A495W1D7_9PSEU|nr:tetratricopeptide repeat protein [Saccharothrix australiensis]RKT54525.1 putative ATPase [Saccharothrix australiensis]